VFQLLKKHYVRYTPEKVSAITGTPLDKLLEVYKLYGSTGKPDRVGTECYAMGWTQHTVGTQNIRAMTIIQQLLGNMGMAGRRHQRAARRGQRPGLHRLWSAVPYPARLQPDAERLSGRPGHLQREEHADDQGTAERQLVGQPPQIHRQLSQGPLRRHRHQGK